MADPIAQLLAQRPHDRGSTRIQLAAEEHRSRPGRVSATRTARRRYSRRPGLPAGAAGDGQLERARGVLELVREEAPVLVVAVVEHIDRGRARAASPAARARRPGGRRRDIRARNCRRPLGYSDRSSPGGVPGPARVRPLYELNGETIASGPGARSSSGTAASAQLELSAAPPPQSRPERGHTCVRWRRTSCHLADACGRHGVVAGLEGDAPAPGSEAALAKARTPSRQPSDATRPAARPAAADPRPRAGSRARSRRRTAARRTTPEAA